MKLFISYARVDMPIMKQIVAALAVVHDIWWDKRLYASQNWWKEIQNRLNWADGFVYLLSPESIASEYCNKEYDIARKAKKIIIPVLIQAKTEVPKKLSAIQYANLSEGLENMPELLNALTIAERDLLASQVVAPSPAQEAAIIAATAAPEAEKSPMELLDEIGKQLDDEAYDQALFGLNSLIERDDLAKSMRTMVDQMLKQTEAQVERQAYLRAAKREYDVIYKMVEQGRREVACGGFAEYRKTYPDYDPENLAKLCGDTSATTQEISSVDMGMIMPGPFEWVEVVAGPTTIADASGVGGSSGGTFTVPRFVIAKYPISNAQFQAFVDDANGYGSNAWWAFSLAAQRFHEQNVRPKNPIYTDGLLPRTDVSWFEAMAFCNWLSDKTGYTISLPTEEQWQRAAQGDDDRNYPWGNNFDEKRCNTKASGIRQPTPINQYPNGASSFGVIDMSGNVFEWCLTEWESGTTSLQANSKRVLRGGSWFNEPEEARVAARNWLNPDLRSSDRGFRVVIG